MNSPHGIANIALDRVPFREPRQIKTVTREPSMALNAIAALRRLIGIIFS
jgi:hypothetical protein